MDASVQRAGVGPQRNREGERRAFARLAFEPYFAPMQLDEFARERQAETSAFLLLRVIASDLSKLLEHGGLIVGRDADSGVAHGDHRVRILFARGNVDVPSVGREFDGV